MSRSVPVTALAAAVVEAGGLGLKRTQRMEGGRGFGSDLLKLLDAEGDGRFESLLLATTSPNRFWASARRRQGSASSVKACLLRPGKRECSGWARSAEQFQGQGQAAATFARSLAAWGSTSHASGASLRKSLRLGSSSSAGTRMLCVGAKPRAIPSSRVVSRHLAFPRRRSSSAGSNVQTSSSTASIRRRPMALLITSV